MTEVPEFSPEQIALQQKVARSFASMANKFIDEKGLRAEFSQYIAAKLKDQKYESVDIQLYTLILLDWAGGE